MPLGEGFSAQEQITGKAEHGGLQIIVYPMKHDVYAEHFECVVEADLDYLDLPVFRCSACDTAAPDMGLSPGGLMRQEIYEDEYGIDVWDLDDGLRCFIHLANDRTPVIRTTVYVGFPYNSDRGRSQNEAQTLHRGTNYFDPEGARGRCLGARYFPPTQHLGEHDIPLEVEVRRYGGLRGQAAS